MSAPIDYRKILVAYMADVLLSEGTFFGNHLVYLGSRSNRITDEEQAVFDGLKEEADKLSKT